MSITSFIISIYSFFSIFLNQKTLHQPIQTFLFLITSLDLFILSYLNFSSIQSLYTIQYLLKDFTPTSPTLDTLFFKILKIHIITEGVSISKCSFSISKSTLSTSSTQLQNRLYTNQSNIS
jgi:hypothetical protein